MMVEMGALGPLRNCDLSLAWKLMHNHGAIWIAVERERLQAGVEHITSGTDRRMPNTDERQQRERSERVGVRVGVGN